LGDEIARRQILGNGGSWGKRASNGNQSRRLHSESEMRWMFGKKRRSLISDLPMVGISSNKAGRQPVPL
jgi:hypothetical protein